MLRDDIEKKNQLRKGHKKQLELNKVNLPWNENNLIENRSKKITKPDF